MKKLGIDLGSASCGWAIREDNEIINKGVITFSTGMMKGTGGYSSPTKDRREARSKRRLIQARKYRKWELLKILVAKDFVPLKDEELKVWSKYQKGVQRKFPETVAFLAWLACDFTYQGGIKYKNPYEIRVKGLDEKLSNHEFGRALYHIVQRRGYKDIGEKDEETKKQLERRKEKGFKNSLQKHGTIAKALKIDFLDEGKRARNEYPLREEYQDEFELLCKTQGFDSSKEKQGEYNDEFVKSLWKAIIWQRPLRSQKGKVGKCTLEPNSSRIPMSHPLFELFRTLQYINTIKTVDENGVKTQIPKEHRESLLKEVFFNRDKNLKFSIIKTYLDKKFQKKMKYNYLNKRTGKYDSTVSGMPVCKAFIDLFDKEYDVKNSILSLYKYEKTNKIPKTIKGYSVHDLWHIIFNSTDVSFLKDFAEDKLGIKSTFKKKDEKEIRENKFAAIQKLFVKGYADLSAKSIKKIIPFLQEGFLYNEAVVLAKIPELLGENWKEKRESIFNSIKESTKLYNYNSDVINITNGLVNCYKGFEYDNNLGYHPKDKYSGIDYKIDEEDIKSIEDACKKYFGEKTWQKKEDKKEVLKSVKEEYQTFFKDSKRTYRTKPTHTDLFKESLKNIGIKIDGDLYHHSNKKNIYLQNLKIDRKTGKYIFPIHKETGIEILPVPLIDSIKNPMFNKAMSILRKLINELLIQGEINEDTEIIVEVARELNDNNKRAAIERYQNEKKKNREKYREFIKEFNTQKDRNINVDERIDDFELWTEQIFEETIDEKGNKQTNKNRIDILKETKAIDRYELWMEQKGQCMYTGKMISITQLFSGDIQMEHTIPRSLLPDNTKANQTVCFSKYNSDVKNNRIPYECPNYEKDDKNGTAIVPRLATWQKLKSRYQELYDKNKKPHGNEDEKTKNNRIQNKHYFKMHLDYWTDKLNRFTCEEIKESWARRQLVDTQMVSKYAKEFLKIYFKKVNVEKGVITAEFRKIYSFQQEDEIKSRNKHTHHAIDAAVLTLIPNNASRKKALLEESYEYQEKNKKQFTRKPFQNFNAQELIKNIEGTTLIFNYTKDKIISQTKKKVRKRGVIQKNEDGSIKWMKGDSIRGNLYKDKYLAKIRDVERYSDGQPKRENGDWKYKNGKDEFFYAKKVLVSDLKTSDLDKIIDPVIRNKFKTNFNNGDVFDNYKKGDIKDEDKRKIRHVRIRTKKGRVVKERVNYKSKHEYKNLYYSESDSIPYAVMLEKAIEIKGEKEVERKMIPIAIHEVAKTFKNYRKFNAELYLDLFHNGLKEKYDNWKLLRVGQKVLVLQNDNELEEISDINFQRNRLYKITQFEEQKILLKHHIETKEFNDYKKHIKTIKSDILQEIEKEYNLPVIKEDENILDTKQRKKDFEDKMYKDLNLLSGYRISRLKKELGEDKTKELLENRLNIYTAQSGKIINGKSPFLGLTKTNWNFLYEGEHFEMDVLGNLNVLTENIEV